MAKTPAERTAPNYTSVYLDGQARKKLDALAKGTGRNRSQMIRALIEGADEKREARLAVLAQEMAELLAMK